ncbi:hypothetical protein [Sulfitobacter sp. 20_GPM-1509m]|uniref:hypothetical protein n=1 Tax=Sulfitobacter sp. 20_GPM-1509m TaxID=1380367 RepID=UPI000490002E|nr:hypothetical protein [Sulfitobacter sp. 20_GPM-1509m]
MSVDFEKSTDGNIVMCPVIGWTPFVAFGMACGLRIEFVQNEEHLQAALKNERKPDAAQIVLTPQQAELLAQDLLKMVQTASVRPDGQGE